ncbi:hypothetical protein [Methanococcoides methylutens]|uniref:hypothetical protein n=1 Tax=Methanococcoides methylutens TaxID=2226 RepID=UPI00064EB3C1|nr:hypothetical protein [Methanococcoides methylutens]
MKGFRFRDVEKLVQQIALTDGANWINAFLAELEQLPEVGHDDKADALSDAVSVLMRKKKFSSYAVVQ